MDVEASGHSFQDETPEGLEVHPGIGDGGNAGDTVSYTAQELEEFLSGICRWTIFEDTEDEIRHLERRGDVLSAALLATRAEVSRLHDAGVSLQEAYEALQQQFRQVVGDTAYWKALAEARSEELASAQRATEIMPAEAVSDSIASRDCMASSSLQLESPQSINGSYEEMAKDDTSIGEFVVPEQGPSEPEPMAVGPREALRAAATEAAREAANAETRRWRRMMEQRGEEVALLRRGAAWVTQVSSQAPNLEAATLCHPSKASEFRQGLSSPALFGRAPPESLCKDVSDGNHGSDGRSSPSQRSLGMSPQRLASEPILAGDAAVEPSTLADGSARKAAEHAAQHEASRRSLFPPSGPPSASKWGPGISPRHCPGLGTRMRKAHVTGHITGGCEGRGGKVTKNSGAQLSTSCQLSSPAAPLRSPSACGSTSKALGLHHCGISGTRCRRRPGKVSLGAPSSRCSQVTASSPAPQSTACMAELVGFWEGKQQESEMDEVLMPEALVACPHEKRSSFALLTASPQRRTSQMAGRLRT